MKQTRFILTLAYMLLAGITANAQSKVGSDIDKFVARCGKYISTDIFAADSGSYSKAYRFDLPKNKRKEVERLSGAFKKYAGDAYNYREQPQGTSGNKQDILYGDANEYSVTWFSYPDRNYMVMLVEDKADKAWRYAYCLAWYDEQDSRKGTVQIIYGKDPRRMKDKKAKVKVVYGLQDLKNINIPQLSNLAVLDSVDWEAFDEYFKEFDKKFEGFDEKFKDFDKRFSIRYISADSIANSKDFLHRFGNIRTSMLEIEDLKLLTSLAQKMVDLCKNHASLLDEKERKACVETLQNMQETIKDRFVAELLQIAIADLENPDSR